MSGSRQTPAGGLVAMAASDGGPAAYKALLAALPPLFPAPILLVQHRHPDSEHFQPLIARRSALPVVAAQDGELPRPGVVHVLPATGEATLDRDGRIRISPGGRCCADPLFEAVAAVHGPDAVGVVLTGRLEDGAAGARALKRAGGRVLVQEPRSAHAVGMPSAAIATGCADHVLPLRLLAPALVALTMVPGASELFRVRLNPWATAAAG